MNYNMIVLDLDGTLTNRDKVITPRTKQSLMEAQKRGIKVVLASGRPTYGVMPLAEELELEKYEGYILSFNGGIIMDCRTREVIFKKELPVEANRKILDLAEKEQVDILTYQGAQHSYQQSGQSLCENRVWNQSPEIKADRRFKSISGFPGTQVPHAGRWRLSGPGGGTGQAALGKNFSVYRSEPFFLEILPRGIDKAQCLAQLLKLLGMEREEMIACGDGFNDLSMIEFAGLGVAMENAVRPVRNAADYVTLSNNDDGVAHVVEKFCLNYGL